MSFISQKCLSTCAESAVKFMVIMVASIFMLVSTSVYAVPVNINKADAELIADSLEGIGVKTAEKIVAYRKQNGDYKSVEGLLSIKGIGDKKLAKIKKDIKLKG